MLRRREKLILGDCGGQVLVMSLAAARHVSSLWG